MLTALVTAVLVSATYGFDTKTQLDYQVDVVFDGFLPVLGGNEGKAEVGMRVKVLGLDRDGENLRASNEMTAFSLSFNGAKLPLTLENAVDYFPKTTVSLTPQGKIVKNNAPDKSLPVKLPGLDVKRFPDITYLPIELPTGSIEVGQKWQFKKSFGDADLDYTCTLTKVDGDMLTISVSAKQMYTVFENDALEVVKDKSDAVAEVETVMTGTGTVVFEANRGRVVAVDMANKSVSTGENFVDKKKIERKLDSTLKVRLMTIETAKTDSAPVVKEPVDNSPMGRLSSFWDSAVKKGQDMWMTGAQWMAMVKLALALSVGNVPGLQGLIKLLPGG